MKEIPASVCVYNIREQGRSKSAPLGLRFFANPTRPEYLLSPFVCLYDCYVRSLGLELGAHVDAPLPCQIRSVIEEQLLVNLLPEAMEDSDTFRNECLYTAACDSVLQVCLSFCLSVRLSSCLPVFLFACLLASLPLSVFCARFREHLQTM